MIKVNYTGVEGNYRYVKSVDKKLGGEIEDFRTSIYPPRLPDSNDHYFEELVNTFPDYEFVKE